MSSPSLTTNPRGSKLIKATKFLNVTTMITTIGVIIALVVNLVKGTHNFVSWVLSIYSLAFCVGIVMVELGKPDRVRNSIVGRNWIARGFAYAYLGLVTTQVVEDQDDDAAEIFGSVIGWVLVAHGLVYALLGVGCAKHLVEKRKEAEIEAASQRKIIDAVRAEQGQVDAAPHA